MISLISVSAIILMQKSGFAYDTIFVMLVSLVLLLTKKIPAPIIVLCIIVLGICIPVAL